MKSKLIFIIIIIGIIIGFLFSLITLWDNAQFYISSKHITFNEEILPNWNLYLKIGVILSLISSIAGLILSIILVIYLLKIKKKPTKKNFIVISILGAVGLLTNFRLGAILVLIGGIIGIYRYKNKK